jgi:hypothetical protein
MDTTKADKGAIRAKVAVNVYRGKIQDGEAQQL